MNVFRAAALLLAVSVAGCSGYGTTAPDEVEVKGKVTLPDGKTLQAGILYLSPILGTGAAREENIKVEGGAFAAKVMPGKYKAALNLSGVRNRPSLPEKFYDAEKSGVELDFSKANADVDVVLK